MSPHGRGEQKGRTHVMIKMRDSETGNSWLLDRNKFINRKYEMQV